MITKHDETFWTNKYFGRFTSGESALEDEKLRDFCQYKVTTISPEIDFNTIRGSGIEGIDDMGKPWTSQKDGKSRVYLFKDMIAKMQELVDEYGESVGYANQHRGMGHFGDYVVLLEKNDQKFEDFSIKTIFGPKIQPPIIINTA